jgi:methionyl-tRNA synthetase
MKKFYITTAIDYVNSLPHLGTAYEKIGADALARFMRMEGLNVHFQMGNDEHSANVKKEADRRNLPPKKYCDEMRRKFEEIWRSLDISYDDFIQTSEPRHHQSVKKFLTLLDPADVEVRDYEGWYCESCEAFQTEKDLVDGQCPTHKTTPKWLKEKNYFFLLSKYQRRLLDHYEKNPNFILPEIRRNEIVSLVKSGLQDTSISRAGFPWGIPFPNDPSHVVYVWFDALINYLTATGFGQAKRRAGGPAWPADLHVIGKDITRFHCVIWPAMLMSAKLPLPKTVFGHGFVFLKGEKMSKTLGNIVSPLDIVPKYGSDALRYYLLRESSFGSDGDFTWENFIKRYNSDLANDLGNLLNRTLGMANKYLDGIVAKPKPAKKIPSEDKILKETALAALKKIRTEMDYRKSGDINFHKALQGVWEVIGTADKYIDSSAPWKLAKEGKREEIARVLYNVVDELRNIAILVAPFLPDTSRKIWQQLGLGKKLDWKKQNFKNIQWGKTPAVKVTQGKPIFPRIEEEARSSSLVAGSKNHEPRATSHEPIDIKKETQMEIDITDFQKIDLRVAEIKQVEKVEGADKLLKLQIDIGGEPRQIVAGIAQHYKPEELVGRKIVVVANLKPATIRGVESRGMLLAASNAEGLSILTLDRPHLPSGAKVK